MQGRLADAGFRQVDAAHDRSELADRRRHEREEHDRHERVDEWHQVQLDEAELVELRGAARQPRCARTVMRTGDRLSDRLLRARRSELRRHRAPVAVGWPSIAAICVARVLLPSEMPEYEAMRRRSRT